MPINNSGGPVALSAIRTELTLSSKNDFKLDNAENGDITNGYVPINQCSPLRPSAADPVSFSEWRGYDHSTACNSVKLGMVYCNYTPSADICTLKFDTSTVTDPTSGTTPAQDTSVALTYTGCLLWDLGIEGGTSLSTASLEYSAKLNFSTSDVSGSATVKPSATSSERHYPTSATSVTNCLLIANYEVSTAGTNFVRFGLNVKKVRDDYPTESFFYVHIYVRRRSTSVPATNYPYFFIGKKNQTIVDRPAVNGTDFGTTIPEDNGGQWSLNFTFNDTNYHRIGYILYNKASDNATFVSV